MKCNEVAQSPSRTEGEDAYANAHTNTSASKQIANKKQGVRQMPASTPHRTKTPHLSKIAGLSVRTYSPYFSRYRSNASVPSTFRMRRS